jgi:ABC-2 type transport system permease protein
MAESSRDSASSFVGRVLAVARHEGRQLVFSGSTYVLQLGFLVVLTVGTFVVGGLFDSNFASLDLMWSFLPWAGLMFVPAIAMRAFSAEGADQECELIASMPLSSGEIVLGKWLAGSALLIITLAFTLPVPLTVAYLGSPDWGAITGGYVGAALLLVTFYAVGLFASSLMGERASAYVLAVAILLLVILTGTDQAFRILMASSAMLSALSNFSPKVNLTRLATGYIELSVVLNFMILAALALWGTTEALSARRVAPIPLLGKCGYALEAILALVVGTALMAGLRTFDLAIDVTQNREYTLSPATMAAARTLEAPATLDLYWSEHESGVPARIRDYANRIERLSRTIERQSKGRLVVNVRAVAPDTEAEWTAMARGIRRVPLSSGDHFFLGAILSNGSRTRIFDYFDIDRARLLEYDLALSLTKIGRAHISKVGLLSPLLTPSHVNEPREGLSFLSELKRSADIAILPFFAETLPNDLDVLIVIGGGGLRPAMLYAIDQFVMRGKGLIVCLDPHNRFNPSSDAMVPVVTGNLETIADVLKMYGLKFEPMIVGDALLAAPIVGEDQQPTIFPFWLRLKRAQLSTTHPVTANLHELLFVEPGSWMYAQSSSVVELVTTTDRSGVALPGTIKGLPASAAAANFSPDGHVRTLAAFLPGPLKSAFPPPPVSPSSHIAGRDGPNAVFAVADVDWLFDPASIEGAGTPAARPLNDNHALLANMIEFSANDVMLAEVRTRGATDRRFTRIESILSRERARFNIEENQSLGKIARIERTIGEVLKTANAKSVAELPPQFRAEIEKLELGLIPVRRRVREIRLAIREAIQQLGRTLTLTNLAAGPVLVCAFAFAILLTRRRRPQQ